MKQLTRSMSTASTMENTLQEGHCVRNRWQVIKKIGQGAFGEVYHCIDKKNDNHVAIKIVSKEKDANAANQLLKLEVSVLRALQGQKYFPKFLAFGKTMRFDYIAMELLGPSLSELRRRQPDRKFSLSTTLRLGEMMLKCIQTLHKTGYVHRDIKPSNFVMGCNKNTRKVYLLDFGLSRQILLENGELRPARPQASFQGTPRYASLNVLNHREAGRHDDLISLFYVLSEFAFQDLPWKNLRELRDVNNAKESFDHQLLVREFPDDFQDYFEHICDLTYADEPNYDLLFSVFDQCIKQRGVKETDPLDFEYVGLIPSVKFQKKDSPVSAISQRTHSDVLIVNCTSAEEHVILPEQLDNIQIENTSINKESLVIEDNCKKQISKNNTNTSVNSKNLYSSCKDTGFSASPPANNSQLQTLTSINTDTESPISNFPKSKQIPQCVAKPKKESLSHLNESILPDSLLQDNTKCNLENKSNEENVKLQSNIFHESKLKAYLQFENKVSGINPLAMLNIKIHKTMKEKRRHSVRRSVSQPARIPSRVLVKNVLNDSEKSQEQRGLPRCWSCPTISLFIRSDLKPPLKQQASFEENVYEVDVMRNVAAARKSIEAFVQIGCRRNSLPAILSFKSTRESDYNVEQESTNKVINSKMNDISLHKGHGMQKNEEDNDLYNRLTFGKNTQNFKISQNKNCSSISVCKIAMKKSLSDSNVVGSNITVQHFQNRDQKHVVKSNYIMPAFCIPERKTFDYCKDICNREKKNDIYLDIKEVKRNDSNYSLCKSPTFKNILDESQMDNKISENCLKNEIKFGNANPYPFCKDNNVKNSILNSSSDRNNTFPENTIDYSKENTEDMFLVSKSEKADVSIANIDSNKNIPLSINASLEFPTKIDMQFNMPIVDISATVNENINSEPISEISKSTSEIITPPTKNVTAQEVLFLEGTLLLNSKTCSETDVSFQSNKNILPQLSQCYNESLFSVVNKECLFPNVNGSSSQVSKNYKMSLNLVESDEYLLRDVNGLCLMSKEPTQTVFPDNVMESSLRKDSMSKSLTKPVIYESQQANTLEFENNALPQSALLIEEIGVLNSEACNIANCSFLTSSQVLKCLDEALCSTGNDEYLSSNINDNLTLVIKEDTQVNILDTNIAVSDSNVSESEIQLAKSLSKDILETSENMCLQNEVLSQEKVLLCSELDNKKDDPFPNYESVLPQMSELYSDAPNSFESFPLNTNNNQLRSSMKDCIQLNVPITITNITSNEIFEPLNKLSISMSEDRQSLENIMSQETNDSYFKTHNETNVSFQSDDYTPLQKFESCNNMSKNIESLHSNLKDSSEFLKKDQIGALDTFIKSTICEDNINELTNKLTESKFENTIQTNESIIPQKEVISLCSKTLIAAETSHFSAINECINSDSDDLLPILNESELELIKENTHLSCEENIFSSAICKENITEIMNTLTDNEPEQITENSTPRYRRRQRENSDNKYIKDEKELNLNFTRRRQRPSSQIYDDTVSVLQSDSQKLFYASNIVCHHPENSENFYSELLKPPSDDPPPNHCLPSRRVRYSRSLTSMSSAS